MTRFRQLVRTELNTWKCWRN